MQKYDVLIIGSGFAGSVMAERFANDNKRVLILEKRSQIAGNMYDYSDDHSVLVHKYGPHIFHTNRKDVFDYLSMFTDWYFYEHRVLGYVEEKLVPIPFNLRSIELCFEEEKAKIIKENLISNYGMDKKVTILELRKNPNPVIVELADFIYEHVFKYYTMKQWGLSVEEIDPAVTNRVPVLVSYDDRYFQEPYQFMPKNGYTKLFEKLLSNPNISVQLNVEAKTRIELDWAKRTIKLDGNVFSGPVIFTGAIDQLLDYRFGSLPYRSEEFELKSMEGFYQQTGTVNYPTPANKHPFTRITEYKHLMEKQPTGTTIAIEYPLPYDENADRGNIPYYPIFTTENQTLYEKYVEAAKTFENLYLLGRLAEYKYYNMDAIIYRALQQFEKLKGRQLT